VTVRESALPLYVYFGHHKCASQWINAIVQEACRYMGLRYAPVHTSMLNSLGFDIGGFVKENKLDFCGYTTAVPDRGGQLGDFRGFHVVRDPRDICVSAYFSHRYSHPILGYSTRIADSRRVLESMSVSEGLLYVIKDCREQFVAMHDWDYGHPNILELRLEELSQDPESGFTQIFDFLGLLSDARWSTRSQIVYMGTAAVRKLGRKLGMPDVRGRKRRAPVGLLTYLVHRHRFSAKAGGRKAGEEDVTSHYRKGVAGDWIHHFEEKHVAYFKQHYNGLLVKLGYERDANW
jgi:hypothetical protein